MKHGPIALIDPGFPVIAVATKSATYDKTVSNLMECKARGAKVIVVATEGDEEINKIADCIIRVPAVRDVFSPITRVSRCSCSPARLPSCAAATSTSPETWQKALLSSSWFRHPNN